MVILNDIQKQLNRVNVFKAGMVYVADVGGQLMVTLTKILR